jgi:phage gp29-like protein
MADKTAQQTPILNEIAAIRMDVEVFPGFELRLENPDLVIRNESHGKGLKLYDEIDRDAHAGSVLQTRYLSVVGKEWEVVPAESAARPDRPGAESREKVVADFVSGVLENCNFDQARGELLQGILYGYYVCETMWKVREKDRAIVVDKLFAKHPRRFIFTPDRELRLLTWENLLKGQALPERKFFVFRYGDSDNPYGKGLGQRLFWPVWFKKHGIKFWAVFLEKFGAPTPVGKYPNGASEEEKNRLLAILAAIQTETGIAIPEGMIIEYLEAKRSGTADYKEFQAFMDAQISKAVLGQTATTEGTPGKLGNEQTQAEVRQDIIEADADLLDAALNETLIKWIVDYNFPGVTQYPKFLTHARPKPNLDKQSQIDERNVKSGARIPVRYFNETYGYPVPEEGEEIAALAGQAGVGNAPGTPGASQPQFSESEERPVADLIAERTSTAAGPVTDAVYMAPLKRLVEEAEDLGDLRDRILDLWGAMDPESLGVIMAQGMMLAEMAGQYEVATEILGKKKGLSSPRTALVRNC